MSTFDGENPDDMSRVMVRAAYAEHCEFRVPPGPDASEYEFMVEWAAAHRAAETLTRHLDFAASVRWTSCGPFMAFMAKVSKVDVDRFDEWRGDNMPLMFPTTGAGWIHTDCCEAEPPGAEGLG